MAIVEELKIEAGQSTKTIKSLRSELKELKNQLLNTSQGTEEYNRVVQEAANIQHELREQMAEINASAMDYGQRLGNVTDTMSGISGAITAATGALSLFGVENSEAQKKITATMTSLIGITEGLAKMDDGVKAFKRLSLAINVGSGALGKFKMALISTGIGAIVVLIGSLVAYWDDFTASIGISSEKLQKFGDIAKGILNSITSTLKGTVKALGKLLKGDLKGAWDEFKDGFNVVKNFNEGVSAAEAKREEDQTNKAKEEADKRVKIAEEEYQKKISAAQKLAKYERDLASAKLRGSDSDKYSEKSYEIQKKYFDTLLSVYKAGSEEYKNLILEYEQWLQDWDNHKESLNKKNKEEKTDPNIDAEQAAKARQRLLDEFNNSLKTEEEQLAERYNLLMDAAIKEGADTTEIKRWYEEEKTRIVKEEEEKQSEIRQKSLENYISMASGIGDILGSISDMMEEGTDRQKGMATAAATIQMLVGITSALSGAFTTKSGPWDIALAAIQAASIAASGIANIAKINAVNKDGKGASVSAASSYIPNMMSVNSSMPDLTQTIDGAFTEAAIKDQKVYVLENEITDTQTKVRVNKSNATY